MDVQGAARPTLGVLLRDTSRLIRRHFVQIARERGLPLNRSEAQVLAHLDREQGMSQAQLAERLDLEPISVVRLIDSLQAAGLVERRSHPHDRRIRTLWLTEAAQAILPQVMAVRADVRAQAIGEMTPADQAKLLDLLTMVRGNLAQSEKSCAGTEPRAKLA